MYDLTPRQIDILKNIVREYIDTAEAVGSETLEKKYDLGVSPATIRNEMAEMIKLGYLAKPHASAGRIPTSKAIKFYINELMKEKEMSVAEEVEAKENIWDLRARRDQFLREATKSLAKKTGALGVTVTDEGNVYYAGYSNILDMPEFFDIDTTKNLLSILDDISYFNRIMERLENECEVLLEDDFDEDLLKPYGFVFSRFETRDHHIGTIGVIGPVRMQYELVIPTVRYYGNLVKEVAEW
jgi:heat-inducible transcriptional repressor